MATVIIFNKIFHVRNPGVHIPAYYKAFFLSFSLPIRLNLRGGHQTGFGLQVQRGGGVS